MSAQMLEVSLLGVGTVPRLERDEWSMVVKSLRQQQMSTSSPPKKTTIFLNERVMAARHEE